jgi:hypothetical protein
MKIRPVGERVVLCGRADRKKDKQDRHDEANGRFSQFCERSKIIFLKMVVDKALRIGNHIL